MSLIEGIGDEVTHFFLILFTAIIVYIAWWSTNISEQRQVRTVLLLDRRRHPSRSILRVRLPSRQLTNHTESVTISEGTSITSTSSLQTEEPSSSDNQAPTGEPKPNIASTSSQTTREDRLKNSENPQVQNNSLDSGEVDIIETMDADAQNELRQRRLAHFEGSSTDRGSGVQEASSRNNEPPSTYSPKEESSKVVTKTTESHHRDPIDHKNEENNDNITIKLKYINDEVKVVDGRLEEQLGDFKRRHFVEEMNSNKEVKLIFNGQVLKQDRHNLQSCGLFDNCVVHCLIHQKRPSIIERERQGNENEAGNPSLFSDNPFIRVTNINNNNQGIDWDLGNFLFALVSFILLAAWYFRYVYAHLYTVTATVGLIIITGVFSIILLGAYFPDNELQNGNLRLRVTRTERIEVQQQQ